MENGSEAAAKTNRLPRDHRVENGQDPTWGGVRMGGKESIYAARRRGKATKGGLFRLGYEL